MESGVVIERFPNGTGIIYDDTPDASGRGKHAYHSLKENGERGARVTSLTTAIKPIDFKPDGLMKWAAKINGIGIADLVREAMIFDDADELKDALSWATDYESIWRELVRTKLTWEDVRDRAGTRGTNVHQLALEALATGQPTPDYEQMTDEERGYAAGVTAWWLDHDLSPDKCHEVERIVFSEDLWVAGRYDLMVEGKNGKLGIVDLKTSKYISPSAHVQVAGYDYLSRDCGLEGSDAQYILHVKPDGTYSFIRSAATHEDFLAAVKMYRRSAQLDKLAKAAWAEAQR